MKKIISVLLLSVLFSASASAYKVYWHGSHSCGVWVDEEKRDSMMFLAMQTWVSGFVTGINSTGISELKDTDIEAMTLFVSNYCNANPLDNVANAAEALTQELKE